MGFKHTSLAAAWQIRLFLVITRIPSVNKVVELAFLCCLGAIRVLGLCKFKALETGRDGISLLRVLIGKQIVYSDHS